MFSIKFLIIFGIITYMGQSVHSLKCYVCNEKQHPEKCDDSTLDENELKSLEMDCSSVNQLVPPISVYNASKKATGCVEMTLDLKKPMGNEKDKDYTIRTCYFGNVDEPKKHCTINPNDFLHADFEELVDEECNICTEDLCNSSTVITPLLTMVSISAIAAYISKFI